MLPVMPLIADEVDQQKIHRDRGPDQFESALVRVLDLSSGIPPALQPAGADPLQYGEVEVSRWGWVEVKVQGAQPLASYSVRFCPAGFTSIGNCLIIATEGSLQTNELGWGKLEAPFPSAGTQAGLFVISRLQGGALVHQFVSGFEVQTPASITSGPLIELVGVIESVNPIANSFRIQSLGVDIFVGPGTKFKGGLQSLADLAPGYLVEVEIVVDNDGRWLALEVKQKGSNSRSMATPGWEKGKKRGHDDS